VYDTGRVSVLDNDLAGRIAREHPGIGSAEFEARFVATVESSAADRLDAWTAFYRNTLDRIVDGTGEPGGTIAGFAPVYERAVSLALGADVLELGCCFGFLSLRLAAAGHRVTAVDLVPGTTRLLRSVSARLGTPVHALAGDAAAVPLADGCADTVFAVHLLEHLPADAGAAVLAETLRLARRRVVVAVPFEAEPDPTWGHLRTFDAASLAALGATTGRPYRVHEHHGGWLVLDV
jgi:SAM-dependent methyltransferase